MHVEKLAEFVELTEENYERDFSDRHLLDEALANCAEEKPAEIAIIDAASGAEFTWQDFEQITTAIAAKLIHLGFEKGDVFASSLPMIQEQVLLYYGCLKAGALFLSLDPKLDRENCLANISKQKARAYAAYGKDCESSGFADALKSNCPTVETFICFAGKEGKVESVEDGNSFIDGARAFAKSEYEKGMDSEILNSFTMRGMEIDEDDPALALIVDNLEIRKFTHKEISYSNMRIGGGVIQETDSLIANQPPHLPGGFVHQITTAVFWGKKVVLTGEFDTANTLQTVEKYRVNVLIQDPEQYRNMLSDTDFANFDRSSLSLVVCTDKGQDGDFLKSLSEMAPSMGLVDTL